MKSRNVAIDLAKLAFCFGIVFLHMNPIRIASEPDLIMCFGYLGVEFFFIVSGWLMANSAAKVCMEKTTLGDATLCFLRKKFITIFPYYTIAVIVSIIILHYPDLYFTKSMAKNLLMSIPYVLQLELAGFQTFEIMAPAWFLSAMFLSMFILYPLLLKFQSTFTHIIAPNIAIWGYGYLIYTVGALSTIEPTGDSFLHTGIIRAFAGISLGCCSYSVTMSLKLYNPQLIPPPPRTPSKLLTIIELLCYVFAFLCMQTSDLLRPDFLFLLLISIAVTISFSNLSYTSFLSKSKTIQSISAGLGKLSMCLYLSNAPARNFTCIILPSELGVSRLLPYLIINIIMGFLLLILGDFLLKGLTVMKDKLHSF